ncbi:MAG: cation:proton antiporter [Sinobacteraceae bacterium]|nr:cation:proton antiporter [Nevskiaceae bacterium]
MAQSASVAVFIAQLVTLLVAGRLCGELLQRLGQPPVMGQILAGIVLGPSVLGVLLPGVEQMLFPPGAAQNSMLDALSQLGILLLLLMTGTETDLAVFRDARRTALSISIGGIIVPFACGLAVGAWLPASLLPDPGRRLITTLFLGTALAISSVKIVALVVRDLNFLRRTVGQVIVAAAIIDDTIGWIIMSVTFGLAAHSSLDLVDVARSVLGTAVFLGLAFTVGRRVVFSVIRWVNDHFMSEMPVITAILAITLLFALATEAIGVHLILGAFVAGILIGQSPLISERINEQLRGLILALFMPVFFALAGLGTDLASLGHRELLLLTGALIAVASIGKFSGAFLGGRVGGLTWRESLAVGCGMNARGSTEVVVASIGLSVGVLNRDLYSAIVAMAVVTTLAMPPMLRSTLRRLPMNPAEQTRLEREALESQGFLGRIERLLAAVDDSENGSLAARLTSLIAGVRNTPATVLHFEAEEQLPAEHEIAKGATTATIAAMTSATTAESLAAGKTHARETAAANEAAAKSADESALPRTGEADVTTRVQAISELEQTVAQESRKGYGLLFIGRAALRANSFEFDPAVIRMASGFPGAFAITLARGRPPGTELNILVPITGTRQSRDGAELAIALCQATRGRVTALYVTNPERGERAWRSRIGSVLAPVNSAAPALQEIVDLGRLYGVTVNSLVRSDRLAAYAIVREAGAGAHNLLIMGVSPRPGEQLFFGDVATAIVERAPCSILFVSSEYR